jgi:hypothetical protein
METTEDRQRPTESVDGDEAGPEDVVEFATFIRERPVACRWVAGDVTGDPELMQRLTHMIVPAGWTRSPSTVARAISDAVAHPVTIRVVRAAEVDLTDEAFVPAPERPDVMGDYWLG